MKAFRIIAPAFGAAVSLFALSAHAADGTINFTGEVTSETCTVAVNGQDASAPVTVTLPTVSSSQLATAGETTGQTAVNIQLSNCSGGTATGAYAFFNNGSTVDEGTVSGGLLGNLINTAASGATNVELQMLDGSNSAAIAVGQTTQIGTTSVIALNEGGTTTLPYAVQYYATGASTAGAVASQVTFNISYQ